jgi:prepilin-type N-terminal cleavage/methylation domain-containing protein
MEAHGRQAIPMTAPYSGFTLLETLAATVLLGLLATATIPLALRLGHGGLRVDDRLLAQETLQQLVNEQPGLAHSGILPIATHPGWWLHRLPLVREPVPATTSMRLAPPPYRWVHITLTDGPRAEDPILADVVALILDPVP